MIYYATKLMGAFSKAFFMRSGHSCAILKRVAMNRVVGAFLRFSLTFCAAFSVERRCSYPYGWLVGLVCRFSDWLCSDRVVDAPALQDEPTWDGVWPDVCESSRLVVDEVECFPLRIAFAMREGCGLIADGQACDDQPLEDPPRLR